MTLYTRAGDEGETALLFGQRLSKASPRTEAYGSLDSAISAMGLARALCRDTRVKETLLGLQRELFTVGSELATPPADLDKLEEHFKPVDAAMTEALERQIDDLKAQVRLPRAFIVPGATAGSGAIDMARSLLRTAERRAVALRDAGEGGMRRLLAWSRATPPQVPRGSGRHFGVAGRCFRSNDVCAESS